MGHQKKSAAKTPVAKRQRYKSVQEEFVRGREVYGNVLCVASASAATRRHLAILKVDGFNFSLLSSEEKRSTTRRFSSILRTLGHPCQILVRILPHDITSYERSFTSTRDETMLRENGWQVGINAHINHLRQLEVERGNLLNRSHYIIIPADQPDDLPSSLTALFERLRPGSRRRRSQREYEALTKAQQQLNVRVQEVQRKLNRMGLQVKRLDANGLIKLYRSCIAPRLAQRSPLPDALIASLDRPPASRQIKVDDQGLEAFSVQELVPSLPEEQYPASKKTKRRKKQQGKVPPGQDQQRLTPFLSFADLVSPAGVEQTEQDLCFISDGREYKQTLVPFGVPFDLFDGWFSPLVEINEPFVEISLHISARSSEQAKKDLRRKQNTAHAKRIYATQKGVLLDPDSELTERDVNDLILRCASGEDRMLDVSLYVQVSGASRQELRERSSRVLAVLKSMQLDPHPAYLLHDEGYRSCMPEQYNPLAVWGSMFLPASSMGEWCPFISATINHEQGIWLGQTPGGEPILFDRWDSSLLNANWLVDGPPGYGKSFFVKLWALRRYLKGGVQFIVVDPEREWKPIVEEVRGQWIRLAAGSGYRINPLDLYYTTHDKSRVVAKENQPSIEHYVEKGDRLAEKVSTLLDLFQIMLARRNSENTIVPFLPEEFGFLEQVIYEAYRKHGITSKSNTYDNDPPYLRDVFDVIEKEVFGPDKFDFLPRLYPFVHGIYKSYFDGPTNVSLDAGFVVFDTRETDSRLTDIMLAMISEYVWTQTFSSDIPREFIIDEAGILARSNDAWARFMANIVARARKHWLAVTLILQNIESLQKNKYGEGVLANCDTRILLGRAQTDSVKQAYGLSDSEAEILKLLGAGEGLILTPKKHIIGNFLANTWEYELANTKRSEIVQARKRRDGHVPALTTRHFDETSLLPLGGQG